MKRDWRRWLPDVSTSERPVCMWRTGASGLEDELLQWQECTFYWTKPDGKKVKLGPNAELITQEVWHLTFEHRAIRGVLRDVTVPFPPLPQTFDEDHDFSFGGDGEPGEQTRSTWVWKSPVLRDAQWLPKRAVDAIQGLKLNTVVARKQHIYFFFDGGSVPPVDLIEVRDFKLVVKKIRGPIKSGGFRDNIKGLVWSEVTP